jgi:hypothetical protein
MVVDVVVWGRVGLLFGFGVWVLIRHANKKKSKGKKRIS